MTHIDAATLTLLAMGESVEFDVTHAWSCPRCGEELRALRRVVDLARQGEVSDEEILQIPPRIPPPSLWEQIDAQRHCTAEPPRKRIVWPNWSVAASLIVALLAGATIIDLVEDRGPTVSASERQPLEHMVATVALKPLPGAGRASANGKVVVKGGAKVLTLKAQHLRRDPAGTYQVALRVNRTTAAVALGTLAQDDEQFVLPSGVPVDRGVEIEVHFTPNDTTRATPRSIMAGQVTLVADPIAVAPPAVAAAAPTSSANIAGTVAASRTTFGPASNTTSAAPAATAAGSGSVGSAGNAALVASSAKPNANKPSTASGSVTSATSTPSKGTAATNALPAAPGSSRPTGTPTTSSASATKAPQGTIPVLATTPTGSTAAAASAGAAASTSGGSASSAAASTTATPAAGTGTPASTGAANSNSSATPAPSATPSPSARTAQGLPAPATS